MTSNNNEQLKVINLKKFISQKTNKVICSLVVYFFNTSNGIEHTDNIYIEENFFEYLKTHYKSFSDIPVNDFLELQYSSKNRCYKYYISRDYLKKLEL